MAFLNLCKIKQWPIRKQIMITVLGTTFILELIIFLIIYINLEFIQSTSTSEISNVVMSQTKANMHYISKERGNQILQFSVNLANSLFIMKNILNDLNSGNINLPKLPSYRYEQLNQSDFSPINETEKKYGKIPISSKYSCIFTPNNKPITTTNGKKFEELTAHLDRMFTSYMKNSYFIKFIQRFNVIYVDEANNEKIIRTYPCIKYLNSSYDPTKTNTPNELYYLYLKSIFYSPKKNLFTNTPIFNGPYLDVKTGLNGFVISINAYLSLFDSSLFTGIIQLELVPDILKYYLEEMHLFETGFASLVTWRGELIYIPNEWDELSQIKSVLKVYKYPKRSGITLDFLYKMTNKTKNDDDLEEVQIYDLNQKIDTYYLSDVFMPYDLSKSRSGIWDMTLIIYVKKSEVLSIANQLELTIYRFNQFILFIGMVCCALCMAMQIICCYTIAMSISKPLKRMINVANIINNTATENTSITSFTDQLYGGEYQLGDLAFKRLVAVLENRKNNRTKAQKVKTEYPLNQYHPDFVQKAKKGISEINWRDVIEKIQNNEIGVEDVEIDETKKEYF